MPNKAIRNASADPSPPSIRTFDDYQRLVDRTTSRRSRTIALMGLVGEIGELHSMIKKLLIRKSYPSLRNDLREEFGDVLWYLTSLAMQFGIPLKEIAQENAAKAEALYTEGTVNKFDKSFPKDERLPRQFSVDFYERPLEKGLYVKISVNGVVVGDALSDNAHNDDGYRFHDAFHLAYAAVLGWSPVCRALLRCKRKSIPKIDEVEDGQRAIIVEEAISVLVFNQAEENDWYREQSAIGLGTLKMIRRMARGLEVKACTAKQWQDAIYQGYVVFRNLREHHGGRVNVDLDSQVVSYVPLRRRKK